MVIQANTNAEVNLMLPKDKKMRRSWWGSGEGRGGLEARASPKAKVKFDVLLCLP